MATVNLGRIKPVFRGAYNNSTAYVIDDIVTSGNETFIAIAATQGNATSDASKWTKLAAKGADGADGTDVAATLANKEISFKTNAGALDGIPIGTAGQFLKVNSGATGYEFGSVSSDFVKLASNSVTAGSSSGFNFEGFVNNSTYSSYYLKARNLVTDANNTTVRLLTGTNTEFTGSQYKYVMDGRYAGNSSGYDNTADTGGSRWRFSAGFHASSTDNNQGAMLDLWLTLDAGRTAEFNSLYISPFYNNGANIAYFSGGGSCASNQTWTGLKFYADGGTITNAKVELYGIK